MKVLQKISLSLVLIIGMADSAMAGSKDNGGPRNKNERRRIEVQAKQQLLFLDPVEQSYDQLAILDPGKYHDLERMIEKGKVYLRKSEIDRGKVELHKALVILNEQIKKFKYDRRYYSYRAQVNRELGRIERAIKDMEMVVALTPDDASPMMKMGNFVRLENIRQLRGTEIDVSDTLPPEEEEDDEAENAPERGGKERGNMLGNL